MWEGIEGELFDERSVLEQDIFFGDCLRYPCGFEHISTTQDEDLIGIKDGIALGVEDNQLIAVFLPDLFTELAYADVLLVFGELFLPVHPGLESRAQSHDHKS